MKEIIRRKNEQLELEKYAKTGINPKYYKKKLNAMWCEENHSSMIG